MNILVTGASRGLGFRIVKHLLENSHNVYGLSRNSSVQLDALKENFPDNLSILNYDLEDSDSIKNRIFREFIPNTTPLHALVNNAAFAYDDIITNINQETLRKMFQINTLSPMVLTKYSIRNMIFNQIKGSIVHISSISVHTGYKGLAMYAATKGAVEAFSKNTSREWGVKGIRSNVVVPGFMETDMSSSLSLEQKAKIYKRNSLKCPTSINSVVETVAFLISDRSESITGQNIFVDSGTI